MFGTAGPADAFGGYGPGPGGGPMEMMGGPLSGASQGVGYATSGFGTPPLGFGVPAAAVPQQVPLGAGAISPQEQEYYQQLFTYADRDGRGFLDGVSGAGFLMASGLPQEVLHRIWEIADSTAQGVLSMDRFFVALRLVAHAQAGRPPSPELGGMEPPALPDFQGLQRRRAPSETSGPGSRSPSVAGAQSEYSELQPVIAGKEEQVARAAAQARQHSRSPSPRRFTGDRWVPSQREKRKYASLFKRTDWDNDGFVQGHEASALLERSRLDLGNLSVAWEHADRDRDGKLTFQEFVCLVHLVTCVLRGAPLPSLQEGLPPELMNALMTLESPDVLVAQREASRSRSASPGPSMPASPLFATPIGTPPVDPLGWGGGDSKDTATGEGFGPSSSTPKADAGAGDGFGAWDEGGLMGDPLEKKEKQTKKDRGDADADAWGTGGAALNPEPLRVFEEPMAFSAKPVAEDHSQGLDGLGAQQRRRSRERVHEQSHEDLSGAVGNFNAVVAADRDVARQLRREVDDLDAELSHGQESKGQLERQVEQDRRECGRFNEQRRELERQLQEAKRRLEELREERRAVNLESLSLRRDRGHFAEELAFLRRMADDEENTLEVIRGANQFLERSYVDLEAHAEVLEQQRRELLQQVTKERETVRLEERQNGELRNRLERLRRDHASQASVLREVHLKEQKVREMQGHSSLFTSAFDSRQREAPRTDHSWASSVVGVPGAGGGAVHRSSASVPRSSPAAPMGREGV